MHKEHEYSTHDEKNQSIKINPELQTLSDYMLNNYMLNNNMLNIK